MPTPVQIPLINKSKLQPTPWLGFRQDTKFLKKMLFLAV